METPGEEAKEALEEESLPDLGGDCADYGLKNLTLQLRKCQYM